MKTLITFLMLAILTPMTAHAGGIALENSGLNHSAARYGIVTNFWDGTGKMDIVDGVVVGEKHTKTNQVAFDTLAKLFTAKGATLKVIDRSELTPLKGNVLRGRVAKGEKATPETYKAVFAKNGIDALIYLVGQYNPAKHEVLVLTFLVVLDDGRVEYSYDDGVRPRRRQFSGAGFINVDLDKSKDRERVFGQIYNNYLKADDSSINE